MLIITLRIRGYDVKRVMVDNGSGAKIMYPDLYKGLKLRPEDLTPYSSSLMSFNGKTVMSKGQIRLPMQTGLEIVEVDFIVVDTYSVDDPERFFQVGSQLPPREKEGLIGLLRKNVDVFA